MPSENNFEKKGGNGTDAQKKDPKQYTEGHSGMRCWFRFCKYFFEKIETEKNLRVRTDFWEIPENFLSPSENNFAKKKGGGDNGTDPKKKKPLKIIVEWGVDSDSAKIFKKMETVKNLRVRTDFLEKFLKIFFLAEWK